MRMNIDLQAVMSHFEIDSYKRTFKSKSKSRCNRQAFCFSYNTL